MWWVDRKYLGRVALHLSRDFLFPNFILLFPVYLPLKLCITIPRLGLLSSIKFRFLSDTVISHRSISVLTRVPKYTSPTYIRYPRSVHLSQCTATSRRLRRRQATIMQQVKKVRDRKVEQDISGLSNWSRKESIDEHHAEVMGKTNKPIRPD